MDFFHHQDLARRQTRWLLLYFVLAIIGIVVVLNGVFFLIFYFYNQATSFVTWWYNPLVQWLTAALVGLMISASFWRMRQLEQSTTYLADLLGALEVPPSTMQPEERRLLNVVEEISIASGLPVPTVYVLANEGGINAFVAGLRPTETILVVTRGLLEKLSRDELQGVIAHEFSHILNGDMRLNLKLVGGLAGILVIGQLGIFLFTNGTYRYQPGRQHDLVGAERIKKIEISPFMLPIAILLTLIGAIGLFLGRIIKAAISRQRELLADASAVQFTRDRTGLLNALLKIRNNRAGSLLFNLHAEEVSHMCFGQVNKLSSLSATHPPIDQRIIQLNPTYKYRLKWRDKAAQKAEEPPDPRTVPAFPEAALFQQGNGYYQPEITAEAAQNVSAQVGNPTPEHLAYASTLYQSLPPILLTHAHDPEQAQYIIYALLWQGSPAEQAKREQLLTTHISPAITAQISALRDPIQSLGIAGRLPLLDLTMPALKRLRYQQRQPFLKLVSALIKADNRVSLFEFVLATILRQHLAPNLNARKPLANLTPILPDLAVLLSVLAQVGGGDTAFQAGWQQLQTTQTMPRPAPATCSARRLQQALNQLQGLKPMLKKQVLEAFTVCALQDQQVRPQEFEIVRAIAETLDCPMPPLLVRT